MIGNSLSTQHLLDMNLFSIAQAYNLNNKKDRQRSVTDLEVLFFRIVRETSPDLFIEAGAKDASTSLVARKHLPEARIVAFEANPYTYQRFAPGHGEGQIEYIHQALSDAAGEVSFNVMENNDTVSANGRGSLLVRADEEIPLREVRVSAERLDSLFPPRKYRNCSLWIDVEGASKQVLQGAQWLFPKVSTLFIEVEDRPVWKDQWLSGDVIDYLWKNGLAPVARDFQSRYQYNIVFARKELLSDARIRLFLSEYRSFAVYPQAGSGR